MMASNETERYFIQNLGSTIGLIDAYFSYGHVTFSADDKQLP